MLYTFNNEQYPAYIPEKQSGFLKELPPDSKHFPELYGGFLLEPAAEPPAIFMADASPGIYSVKIRLLGQGHVFAGPRRLYAVCGSEEETCLSFTLSVGDIIASHNNKRQENNKIVLTFCGGAKIISIQIDSAEAPVIWLAGDSTVTDQSCSYPYEPGLSYAGWGQMLGALLSPGYALRNLARSGLTTDTFREGGYYSIIQDGLKASDYVLIQFGHNDQKLPSLLPRSRYYDNLLRYIQEVREKGAMPVLVTPLARNTWNCGSRLYNDLLLDYAQAAIDAANQAGVPCIDLHQVSVDWIKELGLEGAKPFFYPGDYTHTNDYGACSVAHLIRQEVMTRSDLSGLRPLFAESSRPLLSPARVSGWMAPPQPASPDSSKSGKITVTEALDYAQKSCKYFARNPIREIYELSSSEGTKTSAGGTELSPDKESTALLAAKQNGYYLEKYNNTNRPILWEEWKELLALAYSGRYDPVIAPELALPSGQYADWDQAVDYARLLEEATTGCRHISRTNNITVAGS